MRINFFTVIFLLISFTVPSISGEIIVQSKYGDVRVKKADSTKWVPVEKGSILKLKDTIQTATKSGAMLFISGSENIVSIEENSRIVITESLGSSGNKKSAVLVAAGKIKSRIKKTDPMVEEFITPTAVVGVRGTELLIAVAEEGTTQVGVLKGEVQVTGDKGEVSLSSNQASEVPRLGGPKDKIKFTGEEDWNKWMKDKSESIKGHEKEILEEISILLDSNYRLIDSLEQDKEKIKLRMEELKNDTSEESATELTKLITDRSRLIIQAQNIDLKNQALIDIAENIYSKKPKDKELKNIYKKMKDKFEKYHSRYTKNKKSGCLNIF